MGAFQVRFTWCATVCPVPLRLIAAVPPLAALLVTAMLPVSVPATVGSNWILSVADWPGFSVTGGLIPEMLKPVPVTVTALMVSAAVPDEVSVTCCVAGEFRSTLPKLTLVELMVSAAVAVSRLME